MEDHIPKMIKKDIFFLSPGNKSCSFVLMRNLVIFFIVFWKLFDVNNSWANFQKMNDREMDSHDEKHQSRLEKKANQPTKKNITSNIQNITKQNIISNVQNDKQESLMMVSVYDPFSVISEQIPSNFLGIMWSQGQIHKNDDQIQQQKLHLMGIGFYKNLGSTQSFAMHHHVWFGFNGGEAESLGLIQIKRLSRLLAYEMGFSYSLFTYAKGKVALWGSLEWGFLSQNWTGTNLKNQELQYEALRWGGFFDFNLSKKWNMICLMKSPSMIYNPIEVGVYYLW